MKLFATLSIILFFNTVLAQQNDSWILTPKPSDEPKINAVRVYGVRPRNEFRYKIPATGNKPITYSIEHLPEGLFLNSHNGLITGVLNEKGEHRITLIARNQFGQDSREMTIKVGERICLTPPMGWNSWYTWSESVSDEKIREAVDAFVRLGLIDYGWTYINIDDCWQGKREGENKALQANEKFPEMKVLCNYVHDQGLKIGIYSTPWVSSYAGFRGGTCDNPQGTYDTFAIPEKNRQQPSQFAGSYPGVHRKNLSRIGEYWFLDADAKQIAEWGFDYVKLDWKPNDIATTKHFYRDLQNSGRDIIFSVSNNAPIGNAEGLAAYSNLWRTTTDISDSWTKIIEIVDTQYQWRRYTGPGHWSDPDMLQIGNFGTPNTYIGKTVPSKLTPDEQYSQMSFWALQAAPLILSCNLNEMDDFTLSLITNREVIDIDQDPLGISADYLWLDNDDFKILFKALYDGSMAVGIFNMTDGRKDYLLDLKEFHYLDSFKVRDVWRQKDLGVFENHITVTINPHGVRLLRLMK